MTFSCPRIVHVLGCHGSGKSTLVQAMVARSAASYATEVPWDPPYSGTQRPDPVIPFTVIPLVSPLVVVGHYLRKPLYGMDRVKGGKPAHLAALDIARSLVPNTWAVIWEGVTMQHMGYNDGYTTRGMIPLFVHLSLPLEECFRRIELRGGKKASEMAKGGKNIADKHREAIRAAAKVHAAGYTLWTLDALRDPDTLARTVIKLLAGVSVEV